MDDTGPATTSPVTIHRDGKVAIIHLDDGKANALGHAAIAALLAGTTLRYARITTQALRDEPPVADVSPGSD